MGRKVIPWATAKDLSYELVPRGHIPDMGYFARGSAGRLPKAAADSARSRLQDTGQQRIGLLSVPLVPAFERIYLQMRSGVESRPGPAHTLERAGDLILHHQRILHAHFEQ